MKRILCFLVVCLVFISCKKDGGDSDSKYQKVKYEVTSTAEGTFNIFFVDANGDYDQETRVGNSWSEEFNFNKGTVWNLKLKVQGGFNSGATGTLTGKIIVDGATKAEYSSATGSINPEITYQLQ